jgi:hypothetical protein
MTFGRKYRIVEEIGKGGMGLVYRAEDIILQRDVALKFLPPGLATDDQARERFIREARAASVLDHPNICTIHEIDETEDGQLFIVMPCYPGENLADTINRGPLGIDEVLRIAIQVSGGLARAHAKGIIHRDIKPGNVMVTPDGVAKIMDFGLARLASATGLTRDGIALGTAAYMSPEQACGSAIDHRTDIWSLGVSLYLMVTGRAPFSGEYEQAIVYSILNTEPEPMARIRADVPPELDAIIAKCMAKDRDDRYRDAQELQAAMIRLAQKRGLRDFPPAIEDQADAVLPGYGERREPRQQGALPPVRATLLNRCSDGNRLRLVVISVASLAALIVAIVVIGRLRVPFRNATPVRAKTAIIGRVTDTNQRPIPDAVITIDGYDFEARSKSNGEFRGMLQGVASGEVVTLRAYNRSYTSYSTDRLLEADSAIFNVILQERTE